MNYEQFQSIILKYGFQGDFGDFSGGGELSPLEEAHFYFRSKDDRFTIEFSNWILHNLQNCSPWTITLYHNRNPKPFNGSLQKLKDSLA
jgi:hypothetical protein